MFDSGQPAWKQNGRNPAFAVDKQAFQTVPCEVIRDSPGIPELR
jgi:hypothetical protein